MALSITLDVTDSFNSNLKFIQDLSGWDYCVVHAVTPTSALNFTTSNDSGAIKGVSDGSSVSATNFLDVYGLNLSASTPTYVKSLAASGIVKFDHIGQFLQLASSGTATKILLFLTKIS